MTAPAQEQQLAVAKQWIYARASLSIADGLSPREWLALGRRLRNIERGHQWWIGDWANYGQQRYGELKKAAEAAGFDYGTVRNCAYVAKRFELSRRRDTLEFGHHQAVASLPDAAAFRLLKDAEERGTSVADLKVLADRERHTIDLVACEAAEVLAQGRAQFGTIYADPPWPYDNQATRAATGRHYDTLSVDKIADLRIDSKPVAEWAAADAHLHLWTTNAFLFDAARVIEAWGFEYKSCFVWVKPQMGIGNYWRVAHEFLLLAVRGSASFRNHAARSWLEARREKHSSKPEAVRRLIESASPAPRLELFGRRKAAGWTVWGNEREKSECQAKAVGT